jgi:DHA2 family multidrug resistance protein
MVFVPLSAITLGELPNAMVGNGSGLYNLMRNIGGSIGISIFETLLVRHEQLHHSQLVQHLAPTSVVAQDHLHSLTNMFSNFASEATAHHQAIAALGQMINRQAALLSYVDDFRYMALACFCCLPVVWMLKRVRGRSRAGAH